MLNVNPKMVSKLDELERDLFTRRQRAETECWRGEIEGIDLTLTFLRAKRDQARRLSQRPLLQIRSTVASNEAPVQVEGFVAGEDSVRARRPKLTTD
jgi:hypothetical protein